MSGPLDLDLPTSTVELTMWCENLADADLLSMSDPACLVYIKDSKLKKDWFQVGMTEIIKDSLNPRWEKKFLMDYRFEERQCLRFEVYDWDSESKELPDHDFLGWMECTFGEIVSKQNTGFTKFLEGTPGKPVAGRRGKIHVIAEELSENKEHVTFKFSAKKLDRKDWFGKSDPFLELHRSGGSNQYCLVHRTEVVKKTLDPDWKTFRISVRSLTNGDDGRDIKMEVYDWNRNGTHSMIGTFNTTLGQVNI